MISMIKQHTTRSFAAVMMLILLLMSTSIAFAQDDVAEDEATRDETISDTLYEQLELLQQFTREARGLEEKGAFQIVFPTRADLALYLSVTLEEELSPEVLAEEMAFYSAFDFLPADYALYEEYESLYMAQIGGFYDPETKDMNVLVLTSDELGDELPLFEQIIYVHEYTHTLQDMNFDLTSYLDSTDAMSTDEAMARLALVEGDASNIMSLYTVFIAEENPLATLAELLLSGMEVGGLTLPAGTPDILGAELLFPYEAGMEFVTALYQAAGWAGVNDAFSMPPISTEQILHPDKYLEGDMPQEVTLPDVGALLGDDWQLANEGRMGEFHLQQYLITQISRSTSRRAAAGWGGDAYVIYEDDAGNQAWVLSVVWDSPEDEAEFREAYADFAMIRFDEAVADAPCWSDLASVTCLSVEGTTLVKAPTLETALALLNGGA